MVDLQAAYARPCSAYLLAGKLPLFAYPISRARPFAYFIDDWCQLYVRAQRAFSYLLAKQATLQVITSLNCDWYTLPKPKSAPTVAAQWICICTALGSLGARILRWLLLIIELPFHPLPVGFCLPVNCNCFSIWFELDECARAIKC